ncbi:hypothetical protein EJ110_NYTH13712 [Nymphaea thermarum]|nr:hypothetical protein EJ110_NYTH13712 [Nymphaea thermarum]
MGTGSISEPGPMGCGYRGRASRGFFLFLRFFHVHRVFFFFFLFVVCVFLHGIRAVELGKYLTATAVVSPIARRSTWTQSSPDAVEVPASFSALPEIFAAAATSDVAPLSRRRPAFLFPPPWVASCPAPLPHFRRRRLFVPVPLVAECLFEMAEEMGPKNDVVLDAGSAPKTENVSIQVTSIRLTKDNYLSWSAALEIGITSRGRLSYITGDKPAPSKSDPQWATWALEDSQGDLSVAAFYAALKTKWKELDYHVNDEWNCGSDHSLYWEKEWMDRTFLFLGGLRDEFESIRSQILNGDEIPGIEEVYARVESEEQRRQVMHFDTGHGPSAFVSRASGTGQRPARRCTHCNKLGHSVDFCWDIHPEKRLVRGRPPSGRRSSSVSDSSQSNPSSGTKSKLNDKGSHMEGGTVDAQPIVARDHLFGQAYVRQEKAAVEDVVDVDRTNPNSVISPDDPSPSNEELPIALRKGTRFAARQISGIKNAALDAWRLAFSMQVNPLAAIQPPLVVTHGQR